MVFKKLLLFKWINLFLFCNVISPSVKGATLRSAASGGEGGKEEVAAAGARPVESVVVSRDDIPEAVIINIVSTNSPCRNCMQMMLNILKDGSEFKNRLLKNWFPGLPADRNLDEIKVYIIYTYKYKQESFSMPAIVDSSTYELSVLKYGMILHGHA